MEIQADKNIMKFKSANARSCICTGTDLCSSTGWKHFWSKSLEDTVPKLSMGQQYLFAVKSDSHILGYSSKSAREVIITSIQHCWDHISSPVSSSGLSHTRKIFSHWSESSAGPSSQLCSPWHIKRGTQCAQLWEEQARERPYCSLKGERRERKLLLEVHNGRITGNGQKREHGQFNEA